MYCLFCWLHIDMNTHHTIITHLLIYKCTSTKKLPKTSMKTPRTEGRLHTCIHTQTHTHTHTQTHTHAHSCTAAGQWPLAVEVASEGTTDARRAPRNKFAAGSGLTPVKPYFLLFLGLFCFFLRSLEKCKKKKKKKNLAKKTWNFSEKETETER